MKINFSNKTYTFLKAYQRDDKYRIALDQLAQKTFNLSFETWYQVGYWNENCVPYTLFDEEKAISNIFVNLMDFDVFGQKQRYIQLGTVMTDEHYGNQGLNRFLMEKVLEDWDRQCDLIYLYANNTVLDFYPKFGFTPAKEYVHFKAIKSNTKKSDSEKLNMDSQVSRALLYDYAKNTTSFGQISMRGNADLVMFYCTSFFKENVYYLKLLDTIAVAKLNGGQLHLLDVFAKKEVALDDIISVLATSQTNEVLLGFTPKDCSDYETKEIISDDTLFIQQGKILLFSNHRVMFPLLSHT